MVSYEFSGLRAVRALCAPWALRLLPNASKFFPPGIVAFITKIVRLHGGRGLVVKWKNVIVAGHCRD
jgi:hypothetical protein